MTKRISLMIACAGSLVLAAGASAQAPVPPQSATQQMSGVACSATATFTPENGSGAMSYNGGVSCAGGGGQKTIDVVPQVQKISHGHELWFSISLAGLYQGPTPINPIRLSATRPAVTGHVYRLLVYGAVTLPDGRSYQTTACAGASCGGAPTLSVRPTSTYLSQTTNTDRLNDVPCWVGHHELIFSVVNRSLVMNYGGHTICAEEGGQRSLTLCAQVVNHNSGKDVWFTISGSCLSQTTTNSNLVELITARTAYTGHGYRVKVSATVSYRAAHGTFTRSATLYRPLGSP